MKVEKQRLELERADTPQNGPRRCDWPGCEDSGEHRAPRSRQELKSYHWFCLDHVRAYNKAWNYYAGMTDEEVELDVREDTVWNRPSWPLGAADLAAAFDAAINIDGLGAVNGFRGNASKADHKTKEAKRFAASPEGLAMAVLDLLPPVTPGAVKARYKELVKRYHPDVTGGDKALEEKFKKISQAYKTIMASL